jgi:AraC family transcriptional regulator, transcriptional activator of pobA
MITSAIPILTIGNLSGKNVTEPELYFNNEYYTQKQTPLNRPYRSNYYGIGICMEGNATLHCNLDSYDIKEGSLITISPQVIKQWTHCSPQLKIISVFFTKDFLIDNTANNFLEGFSFFELHASHVTPLSRKHIDILLNWLHDLNEKINSTHPHGKEIVKSLLRVLLFEVSSIYNEKGFTSLYKQTRSEQLTHEFKKLVSTHFIKERSVTFYADLLFVTPKHLTETVREVTGKSAGEWIDETVMLEAKILLQEPATSIATVADALHFADQSIFGKYFKNLSGLSPLAYRQSL